jgi:hypothetical protein
MPGERRDLQELGAEALAGLQPASSCSASASTTSPALRLTATAAPASTAACSDAERAVHLQQLGWAPAAEAAQGEAPLASRGGAEGLRYPRDGARRPLDPRFSEAWDIVSGSRRLRRLRSSGSLGCSSSPTFQLSRRRATRSASSPIRRARRADGGLGGSSRSASSATRSGSRRCAPAATTPRRSSFPWKIREYFFDADHLTPAGHAVVAEVLLGALERAGMLEPQAARGTAP